MSCALRRNSYWRVRFSCPSQSALNIYIYVSVTKRNYCEAPAIPAAVDNRISLYLLALYARLFRFNTMAKPVDNGDISRLSHISQNYANAVLGSLIAQPLRPPSQKRSRYFITYKAARRSNQHPILEPHLEKNWECHRRSSPAFRTLQVRIVAMNCQRWGDSSAYRRVSGSFYYMICCKREVSSCMVRYPPKMSLNTNKCYRGGNSRGRGSYIENKKVWNI